MTADRFDEPTRADVEALVRRWVEARDEHRTRSERNDARRLRAIVADPASTAFVAAFLDRTGRPERRATAADQLARVVRDMAPGSFLSPLDASLLRVGRWLAPLAPDIVMPLAERRLRQMVGHLVAPAETEPLRKHMAQLLAPDRRLNVNLLGEAVLGKAEADRRFDALVQLLAQPDVDYVSVKLSSIVGRVPHWDHALSVDRLAARLGSLLDHAAITQPRTFVNVDMEEYVELDATIDAFTAALNDPSRIEHEAGIVLQTYLPDTLPRLQRLAEWASERQRRGGAPIKVRLVKGANLAMERVEAERHGWPLPTVESKAHADANFKLCIDWLARSDRMQGVRLGVASHNLFDLAWTRLLVASRDVEDRVEFEMLQGMAPGYARQVAAETSEPLVTYTPAVAASEFDVALGYLFRRLEENAAPANFMRDIDELGDAAVFAAHAEAFQRSLDLRPDLCTTPARTQDRADVRPPERSGRLDQPLGAFVNEADTDPSLPANRAWMATLVERPPVAAPPEMDEQGLETVLGELREGASVWAAQPPSERARRLDACADALTTMRGELIATMVDEVNKTVGEADIEVSEAIDFARYYARQVSELTAVAGARFDPFGVIAVCSPWNFPVAIACGGVFASLAAGNTVALKPSPAATRCGALIEHACRAAGLGPDVMALTAVPDGPLGRRLVTEADAVILTGSTATADRFIEWKPDMRLFAETSGKNAMVITPSADLDLAVADLVASAFGHAGQKCSAASLAILVGEVGSSQRFERQLVDAVTSLAVGPADALGTDVAPLIAEPNERLQRAFDEPAEAWLVRPAPDKDNPNLWSPGVLADVDGGSWFHRTECFGPVLGIMRVDTLDEAIDVANASEFGLTGGIHTLDPQEAARWLDRIEVGNAYINRSITGAVVQRQPFGGWKASAVGPGAKAGGPNYVAQLGTWTTAGDRGDDFTAINDTHFSVLHDPSGLTTESNVFRYVPVRTAVLCHHRDADLGDVELARAAAATCGVGLIERTGDAIEVLIADLAALRHQGVERIRLVGPWSRRDRGAIRRAAHQLRIPVLDAPVVSAGRIELTRWCKEQSVSQTMHRFGSTLGQRRAVDDRLPREGDRGVQPRDRRR